MGEGLPPLEGAEVLVPAVVPRPGLIDLIILVLGSSFVCHAQWMLATVPLAATNVNTEFMTLTRAQDFHKK